VIGYSWALYFSLKNLDVVVYDISNDSLDLAKKRVHDSLKSLIKNNVVSETESKNIEDRIIYTTSIEDAVKDAKLIVESAPENYDIKRDLVKKIEEFTCDDAIIVSSTSGLLISEIARDAKHPERFIGGHPYNPPHLIPLVEITKGDKTSDDVVQLAKEFYTLIGKEPVVLQKEALGFICNRIQMALYREVCDLVSRGVCTVEDADKAVTYGPGLRWGIMGPSLVFQLGGGEHGISGLLNHLGPSINMWLEDMADFKEFPKEFGPLVQAGVKEEIANRPKEIGNDDVSLAEYRDKMLIEMLKLHNKL
ncbi:MAG: 3-hydroxyacyl-CoA dehydrogenase family protein, partial [Bacilli bacterium]|nr:3-hydroxyacyl-CoA dehydrogenase family protein [Bacilli bacterium]